MVKGDWPLGFKMKTWPGPQKGEIEEIDRDEPFLEVLFGVEKRKSSILMIPCSS